MKKNSFISEHKPTIAIIIIGFIAAIIFIAAICNRDKVDANNQNVSAEINNPYDEGSDEWYGYQLHDVSVTGTMEFSTQEDGTKVSLLMYEDGWTIWLYKHPDGTFDGKVDNIP